MCPLSVSRRRRGVDFSNWVVDEPPANEALALLLIVAGQRRLQLGLVTEKEIRRLDHYSHTNKKPRT